MAHLGITPNTSAYSTSICKEGYIIYSLLRPQKDTFLFLRSLQRKCPTLNIISVTHACAGSRALTAQHAQCFGLELLRSEFGGVVSRPVPAHSPVPAAEQGMGTGLSQAVLLCIGTSVCTTSSPPGMEIPARGSSAWCSNWVSCSSCLQTKYASKPPVYTNGFLRGAVFVWVCQSRAITNCRGA